MAPRRKLLCVRDRSLVRFARWLIDMNFYLTWDLSICSIKLSPSIDGKSAPAACTLHITNIWAHQRGRYLLHKFTYNYLKNRFGHFVRHFIAVGPFFSSSVPSLLSLSLSLACLLVSLVYSQSVAPMRTPFNTSSHECTFLINYGFGECKGRRPHCRVSHKLNTWANRVRVCVHVAASLLIICHYLWDICGIDTSNGAAAKTKQTLS